MAKHAMTPKQDLLVREFYVEVAMSAEDIMPGQPGYARQLRAICMSLLNYDQLAGGAFVTKGTQVTVAYGTDADYSKYPCEWEADYDAAVAAIAVGDGDVPSNSTDTSEASTSKPSTYSKVREALFPKDV